MCARVRVSLFWRASVYSCLYFTALHVPLTHEILRVQPTSMSAPAEEFGGTEDVGAAATKRAKPDMAMDVEPVNGFVTASAVAWQPPSQASLYEQGLECKAQAHTMASSWTVDARAWRGAGFANADVDGSHLRQKQLECRRIFLSKPSPADKADG